jgi:hypothetical protein
MPPFKLNFILLDGITFAAPAVVTREILLSLE